MCSWYVKLLSQVSCCGCSSSCPVVSQPGSTTSLTRNVCADAYCIAFAGDVLGLQQQLEVVSDRLISGLTQLEGVSSSGMRRLEEQATTLADAVAVRGPAAAAVCDCTQCERYSRQGLLVAPALSGSQGPGLRCTVLMCGSDECITCAVCVNPAHLLCCLD
jgi:hypothetical protein